MRAPVFDNLAKRCRHPQVLVSWELTGECAVLCAVLRVGLRAAQTRDPETSDPETSDPETSDPETSDLEREAACVLRL